MNQALLPLALVVLASFFQGTFGLGMKKVKPLAWEAWWLVYAVVAMIVLPIACALVGIPALWQAIADATPQSVMLGALFGFLWGVGGILFGLSVSYVGMSLTYGIVMGLAGSIGSVVPLLGSSNLSGNPAVPYVLAGVAAMIGGVALVAWAGVQRDSMSGAEISGIRKGREFRIGLLIAVTSGVLSALLNIGFASAAPIAQAAIERGALPRNASLAAWVVVLAGAFVMNACYALILLVRHRVWSDSASSGASWKACGWAVLTGLLWFAALGVYGQGAALMGSMGPVIGWPMLLGLALIVSNLWAIRAGEWKGAAGPMRLMFAGVGILIAACALLGYSNSLQS